MSGAEGVLARLVAVTTRARVPFMIAGSFASALHGFPRTTQDLDVVIDPPDSTAFESLVTALEEDAFYVDPDTARDALRRRAMFNAMDRSAWKIDFILRKPRPFSIEEFRRRRPADILGVSVCVASAEDTIIAKLEWSKESGGSERQRRDVAGILATMGAELDHPYIDRWVAELALESEWAAVRGAFV